MSIIKNLIPIQKRYQIVLKYVYSFTRNNDSLTPLMKVDESKFSTNVDVGYPIYI